VIALVDFENDSVRTALEFAVRRMPLLERAGLARHWAGLYEMTPDAHPLVGRLEPFDNVFVGAGFSGHGFKFASVVGEILADLATSGQATSDADFLRATRLTSSQRT